MKILTLSLSIVLFAAETFYQSHAFGENRLEQVSELYQPAFTIDETEFSMFPHEKEIDAFPSADVEAESDPQTLSDYYQSVAQAYRDWGDRQKNVVQISQNNILESRERIFLKNNTFSDFQSYNSLASARHQAVSYHKDYYVKQNHKLQVIAKKAEFYQEIADTYKFLATS